ncbi:LacI family DNA-binding transcriptional regulator [Paenibacillus senegalensis]|uniref:LacI family DNA-binding transcriptional regulator n=1 Tax=Paenibacillus senegalensis TaxID=1465766 RepID=UPI0002892CF6|nr:substrate-binding domain-containing protein [Paenibacillus senegalensis]
MTNENKSLYRIIYDFLREKIESQEYQMNEQLPTEAELAEQFQVSRITSRRALAELERHGYIYRKRGSGSYVKAPIKPDPLKRSVQDGLQRLVSMILPFEDASGMVDYIRGASNLLNSQGYYLSIHQSGGDSANERSLIRTLRDQGIPGIIFYPINDTNNYDVLHALYLEEYPIVTIDKNFESIPIGSVVSDNFAGGYMAASKLIELGHRRIGFVSSVSIESTSSVRNRYFGYCRALKDNQIQVDNRIVILNAIEQARNNKTEWLKSLFELFHQYDVTAIQAENDLVAIDLLKYAADAGVRVPQDISIVGFDNHELTKHLEIPLSTIEQDFYGIGQKAAQMVVDLLEARKPLPENITFPVRWIERESTAPVK